MFTDQLTQRLSQWGIDGYLQLVNPTWSTSEIRGRVVSVDRSAAGSIILTIEANRGWKGFEAGQYTQLSVEIDGVRHTRCYSMASAAGSGRRFQLGIKAQADGLVSRHLLAHAEPGLIVGLSAPAGDFVLPATRPDRILLVSGGSGITPVLSMLRTLCAESFSGPITFLHYAVDPTAMLFADEIRSLVDRHPNLTVHTSFDSTPEAGSLRGLFCEEHLSASDPDWTDAETFVCGPAPMMDAVRRVYESAGALHRYHQEAFTLPHFLGEVGDVGGTMRFAESDIDTPNDGRPILALAESVGLTPLSGCRMGICRTCTRTMTCGTVRNAVTGEVTTGVDVEIQLCVNVPVGDVAVAL